MLQWVDRQADVGAITTADGASFNVVDTIKLKGGRIGHVGVVECGTFRVGGKVTLKVDEAKRAATATEPQCNTSFTGGTPCCAWNTCRAGRLTCYS